MNKYWQILILVAVAIAVVFLIPKKQRPEVTATDFESCQAAGGSVTTGEPMTCTMPDGTSFEDEEEPIPEPEVVLDTPAYGALVASPLTVSGKAKGFWFFEANIPVTLKDQTGQVLVQKGFMATGEWMTEDYVDFTGTLEFATPTTEFGVLIINKDNPSGDPEPDASYAIPVRLK